jgi:glycosyltransferase involved in cell wall biosynthesis
MAKLLHHFSEVTLLVTHYNRSRSLERLLQSIENLQCSFGNIVVSDDGSKEEHQSYIRDLQKKMDFQLVTTEKNKGLGNSINKGQDAVTTPYTLYVQEDFEAQPGFIEYFPKALQFMQKDGNIDYIRFYAYFPYPDSKPFGEGFSELIFKYWKLNYFKFYQYSDHPHLRRSSFLQKFGRYKEGVNVDQSEYQMSLSFIKNKGKALFFNDYTRIFDQVNTAAEPSTANYRKEWRLSKNLFVQALRYIYLQIKSLKFNFDYFLYKKT